jgi:hypothetical protein
MKGSGFHHHGPGADKIKIKPSHGHGALASGSEKAAAMAIAACVFNSDLPNYVLLVEPWNFIALLCVYFYDS